ncbi:MAG: DUF2065 domain-containing protein [Halioglobus sp.]|nr:DUF2065 domain-containing protein [Halioglobus sp.]
MDFWEVLPVAIALVLVIEGLLPFISPAAWRSMLAAANDLDDRAIRGVGLASMLLGVVFLYLLN